METRKNMYENFDMILPRLTDSFNHLDMKKMFDMLKKYEKEKKEYEFATRHYFAEEQKD